LREKHSFDWKCEDVYAQCLMGRAFCYTCSDGFVIVKPQENQFTLESELFVWVCISSAIDGLTEYNEDIRAIAKDINATSIIFSSPREGFRKIAKQNGWQSMTEYKFPVN
jgi:hypothetical protein